MSGIHATSSVLPFKGARWVQNGRVLALQKDVLTVIVRNTVGELAERAERHGLSTHRT